MRTFKRLLFWVFTLVLSGSLVGTAGAADTIKIGINEPLTGSVAASGNFITNGAKLAAEYYNDQGGVLGKKIELVVEDNKSTPSGAAAAAEKLASFEHVSAMMGAWGSTFTLAAMPKVKQYKVPLLVETASSSKITTAGNPWVFRIAPTSAMEAQAFAKFVPKLGIKKADFLVVNNDWGLGAADAFGKMLKSEGATIGTTQTMSPSAQDLSAQLTKLENSDADTLFVTTGYEQLSLVIRQARTLGIQRRIVATGGSEYPDRLAEQLGALADNTYYSLFFAPWFPKAAQYPDVAKRYIDLWKKHGYDDAGLSDGFRGFDAITTIVTAIKKAGSAEPDEIRKALWKVNVKGVNGDISFHKVGPKGEESGQSIPNVYVVTIQNGKLALPNFDQ